MTKILMFAGSTRQGSWNRRVAEAAAQGAEAAGAEVTRLDLTQYPLPIFDEDLETRGFPDNAAELKRIFKDHDGLLIGCPEYNSSITPLLKNVIDWVSRPTGDAAPLEAFDGKVAGLVAASSGGLGGLRGLFHVRDILQNIRVIVMPKMAAVGKVHEKCDDTGAVTDASTRDQLHGVGAEVAHAATQLRRPA
ncbi:MAG: NAD(P)H-dependent oxidoreductase [Planctomycetota bacterium]